MATQDMTALQNQIDAAIRNAGEHPCLIGWEAINIQRFVTSSTRPVAIHGASEVLKEFDKSNRLDSNNRPRPEIVFAGGARGVMVVAAESVDRRVEELRDAFSKLTVESPLAMATVPFDGNRQPESLRWLWWKLGAARDACAPEPMIFDKSSGCDDCHARPGVVPSEKPEAATEWVCHRCRHLVRRGREIEQRAGITRWTLTDLLNLPEGERGRGRIAIVSADGNQAGRFFRSLRDLKSLRLGSELVARLFADAHDEGLRRCARVPRHVSVVTGGDDVRVFLPADVVLDYVSGLLDAIEKGTAAIEDGGILSRESLDLIRQLGVSVGFVVAQDHYPASRLVDRAHRLESEAKVFVARTGGRSAVRCAILFASDDVEENDDDRGAVASVSGANWARTRQMAAWLAAVPQSQRAGLHEGRQSTKDRCVDEDEEAEFQNRFRYQVARSPLWRQYFERCGIEWADPKQLKKACPKPAMLALARLSEESQ